MADASHAVPHVERYGNGKVKLRGSHLDGSLMRAGSFDRGKQVGTWRTYDRAGNLVKQTDFK